MRSLWMSKNNLASNFKAFWPTDPIFTAFIDLNLSKKYTKNQEAGSISKVIFALSKWPHLHRVYLIRVPYSFSISVCKLFLGSSICFFFLHKISFICKKLPTKTKEDDKWQWPLINFYINQSGRGLRELHTN